MLDYSYNSQANEVKNDMGLESTQAFTPDAGPLDPRLDWTVGRRGIPFLDWGAHPGKSWTRDQGNGGELGPGGEIIGIIDVELLSDIAVDLEVEFTGDQSGIYL